MTNDANRSWNRHLPEALRSRLAERPNLLRVLANTGWLFADKVVRMSVGLLVGVWVARYLGPQEFGLLNYAIALVAIFGAVAPLGLNRIVVRDLAKDSESAAVTLGTAFGLQVTGGAFAVGLVILFVHVASPADTTIKLLAALLSIALTLRATDVIKYWFEAEIRSKYTVLVDGFAFFVSSTVKVVLILLHAPLLAFVWAIILETALSALGIAIFYSLKTRALGNWRFRFWRAKELLHQSWPIVLSALAIMVQARADQVMLGSMIGSREVGQYSAAMRLIEAFGFVPTIIVGSIAPIVTRAKQESSDRYRERMIDVYRVMFITFLAVAIPIFLFGRSFTIFLLGSDYSKAGSLLALFAVRQFFVNFGVARSLYITNENLFKYGLLSAVVGSILNIVLNYFLIPTYKSDGALLATVISFLASIFLVDLFSAGTRTNVLWMAIGIVTPHKLKALNR